MEKKIIVIGAVSKNGAYGMDGKMPWSIKEDMEHFQSETDGSTVIMGRATWDSLPAKWRPLKNRENFILSNNICFEPPPGTSRFSSFYQAVEAAPTEKVFAIGGRQVWIPALQFCDEAIITEVDLDVSQDGAMVSFIPEFVDLEVRFPKLEQRSVIRKSCTNRLTGYEVNVAWKRYVRFQKPLV